jgi:3,4-dihydroxy 2-butanone 4-phosphate synthase/GTP cyclohydrolase II
MPLSGEESKILTHQIRSIHDSILVGIGTLLADDPQLTTRRVQGRNPQPIILDTKLRFPLNARLLKSSSSPWIMTSKYPSKKKQKALENLGATVFRLPSENNTINLMSLMSKLAEREINSLMVEGGATVISNFIKMKIPDLVISTVTPFFIGRGVKPIEKLCGKEDELFSLRDLKCVQVGRDLIVCGVPHWA